MNYVFFGTPKFASIVLQKLIKAGLAPKAAVCSPDRPIGRKQIVTPPPVKALAGESNIEVLQPEKIDADFLGKLKEINADFYVVAAYAKILPESLLAIPRLGVIGVHPSLLPKFRGPSPIQSAILSGEKETGVSLFMLDKKVDNGPVIASWKIEVGDDNYEKLEEKLAFLAGDLLITTLPQFAEGKVEAKPQNDIEATYTKKFETQYAYIEPNDLEKALNGNYEKALEIDRKVRALNPEPGVFTLSPPALPAPNFVEGSVSNGSKGEPRRTKLLEVKIVDNRLKLVKIQEAGKNPVILT